MVHVVEVALDVGLQNVPTPYHGRPHCFHGLARATLGTIPIRARQEARFEQRLDDDLARLLGDPVTNTWNSQRAQTTIRLRDLHPQHRLRAVRPRLHVVGKLTKERLHVATLDVLDAHAVHAWRSTIRSHIYPGPPQHIGPDNAVMQGVEATAPTPLGRSIQFALESSWLVYGVLLALASMHHHFTPRSTSLKQGAFPQTRLCCPRRQQYYAPLRLLSGRRHRFRAYRLIRRLTQTVACDPERSPLLHTWLYQHSAPHTPEGSSRLQIQTLRLFHGLHVI